MFVRFEATSLQVGIKPSTSGSQSSTKIAQNHVFHKRGKHIAIRYHFIREKVESGEMKLQFVRTKATVTDQLTENVGLQVLVARKYLMGMFSG